MAPGISGEAGDMPGAFQRLPNRDEEAPENHGGRVQLSDPASIQSGSSSAAASEGKEASQTPNGEEIKVPSSVKFIIGNEFCERFSYYGMRAILALYLNERMKLTENQATEAVHLFIVAAYLTPLLGAFISDSYLGKYRTILGLSLVYCFGNWLLSLSAAIDTDIPHALTVVCFGLFFLALGSGGIKPCVSAFGGDQIELTNPPGLKRDRLLRSFFSYFYFSINVGATLSTIITPLLRVNASYVSAFALPAVLMMAATLIFWGGRKQYAHQLPSGNIVAEVAAIMWTALFTRNASVIPTGVAFNESSAHYMVPVVSAPMESVTEERFPQEVTPLLDPEPATMPAGAAGVTPASVGSSGGKPATSPRLIGRRFSTGLLPPATGLIDQKANILHFEQKVGAAPAPLPKRGSKRAILPPGTVLKPHWLDRAKRMYGEERVDDVKQLLSVLIIFVPVPIFWSLYDQQASRWIFQAEQMDGRLPFGLTIYPDQMQTLNSVLILVMIPFFDEVIYPFLENKGFSLRPIRRMVIGMLLGAVSFAVSGMLQLWIDAAATAPANAPSPSLAHLSSLSSSRNLLGNVTTAGSDPAVGTAVHILWQSPQFIIMTAGEIMFSITGLEMAYSQAPASMSSVVSACWQLTVAGGNLFTVLVVGTVGRCLTSAQESAFFTAMCLIAMLLLQVVGQGFTYMESCADFADLASKSSRPETVQPSLPETQTAPVL